MFPSIHAGVWTILWAFTIDLSINRVWYAYRIRELKHVFAGG
jgi:hypothetical protein